MTRMPPLGDRPETLTELVYQHIRDAIIGGVLPPGARLTEANVAQQLNVSKTPVREALLRLREIGLVEGDGRGTRVVESTPEALGHAYEMRELLEVFSARLAAQRATPEDIETLERTARVSLDHAEADDVEAFYRESEAFHWALFRAAGNARIEKAIRDAISLGHAIHVRELATAETRVQLARDHVVLAKAIAERDADAAAAILESHIRTLHAGAVERPAVAAGAATHAA